MIYLVEQMWEALLEQEPVQRLAVDLELSRPD